MGLRTRVALWTAAVLAVSLVTGLAAARHNLGQVLEAKNDSFLEKKAAELEAAARESTDGQDSLNAEIRREVEAYRGEGLIVILRQAGTIEIAPPGADGQELAQFAETLGPAGPPIGVQTSSGQDYRIRRRSLGNADISVALSLTDTQRTLRQFDRRAATWILAFLAAALVGGMLLSRLILRPVVGSIARVKRLSPSDLSTRLPLSGANDELDQLAASINKLLDRLSHYHAQVIRFTADASHELRSPLGVMRAAIEVALQEPRTTSAYRESLASLAEQCDQLSTLVNGLLVLARADSGQVELRREPLDLAALAAETVEMYEPLAEERGISLSCPEPGSLMIRGDRDRLRQLLSNLLDNAIKFTGPGGKVTLRLAKNGSVASLLVSDTGCGIPLDLQPHVFDRFYRGDSARSGDGFGLGLSICRWITEAHHGTIDVQESSSRGTTFAVTLPAC